MENKINYSDYECPYSHIENGCGHELKIHGNMNSVWCACGYRGPVFCLDPKDLGLVKKEDNFRGYIEKFEFAAEEMKAAAHHLSEIQTEIDSMGTAVQFDTKLMAKAIINVRDLSRDITEGGYQSSRTETPGTKRIIDALNALAEHIESTLEDSGMM